MSASPESNMLESQGLLCNFLRPKTGMIEPSKDQAAVIDLAVEPLLIIWVDLEGSIPIFLHAIKNPMLLVFALYHFLLTSQVGLLETPSA